MEMGIESVPGGAAEGVDQMIRPVRAIAADLEVCCTEEQTATTAGYLHELALVCEEAAADPRLRETFVRLLVLVPETLGQLQREQRIAA
jgi:hypothetical protein